MKDIYENEHFLAFPGNRSNGARKLSLQKEMAGVIQRYRRANIFNAIKYCSFSCKSADYNIVTLSCALSRDSRRTQPGSYASSRDTEYLENSCVPSEELSCEYKRTENAYPRYLDTIVTRYDKYFYCI